MKVVLVSDSHGRNDFLEMIKLTEPANYYLHAGDSEMPKGSILPFITVRGNRDTKELPLDKVLSIGNVKIFLTHSHMYNFQELQDIAKDKKIDVVVYGHTHIYKAELLDGIWFVNPGSLARPRGGNPRTYAIMKIDKKDISFEFVKV